jgi:hypothetical protein
MISSLWSAVGVVAAPSEATLMLGAFGSAAFHVLNAACNADAAPPMAPAGLRWAVVGPETRVPLRL